MEAIKAAADADTVIRRALDYLTDRIRIQQAILFGSYARGGADEWSDVDLAVVSPDFAGMTHRQIMDLLVHVALAVDPRLEIRPYAPRDLKQARPTNFLGHILATGSVVYQAGKFRDGGQRRRAEDARPGRRAVERRKGDNDRARAPAR